MLNRFWLRFGDTPKTGMTNFAAIIGGTSVILTTAINQGKLPIELLSWMPVLTSISTVMLGIASGRTASLDSSQH